MSIDISAIERILHTRIDVRWSSATVAELLALYRGAERAALYLFNLLDDVDTASDIAKDRHDVYRQLVHAAQAKRFNVASTDGYAVMLHSETPEHALTRQRMERRNAALNALFAAAIQFGRAELDVDCASYGKLAGEVVSVTVGASASVSRTGELSANLVEECRLLLIEHVESQAGRSR